jgi:hypothetical protein
VRTDTPVASWKGWTLRWDVVVRLYMMPGTISRMSRQGDGNVSQASPSAQSRGNESLRSVSDRSCF